MKANELRIGNYLQFKKTLIIVYGLLEDKVYNHIVEHRYFNKETEEIKPIPLTEEWLLKFGFEKTPLGYKKIIGKKRELTLALCNDKGKGEFYFYVRDNEDFTGFSIRMFSVHQLQNLYFALTGDELTIKQAVK